MRLSNVFSNKHKGRSLEGIIKIAIGEKEEGLKILEEFNDLQSQNVIAIDPSENLRRKNARKYAKEIYNEVNLHKDLFFQNTQVFSEHQFPYDENLKDKVHFIQVCGNNGNYLVTTSYTSVNIWEMKPELRLLKKIELEKDEEEEEVGGYARTVATLDDSLTWLAVYRHGCDYVTSKVQFVRIDLDNGLIKENPKEKEMECFIILLEKDDDNIQEEITIECDFIIDDMRFKKTATMMESNRKGSKDSFNQILRMYVTHNGTPFNLDIDMKNMQQPKYKRARKYEDKSIFKI